MKLLFTVLLLLISFQCFSQEIMYREKIEIVNPSIIHNVFTVENNYYVALTDQQNYQYILKYDNNLDNPTIVKKITTLKYSSDMTDNYFSFFNNTIYSVLLENATMSHTSKYPRMVNIDLYGNELFNKIIDDKLEYQAFGTATLYCNIDYNSFFIYYSYYQNSKPTFHAFNIYNKTGIVSKRNYIEKENSVHIQNMLNIDYKNDLFHFYGIYENNDDDSTKIVHLKYNDIGEKVSERFIKYSPNVKKILKENLKIIDDQLFIFIEKKEEENENSVIPEKYTFIIADTLGNIAFNNEYFFEIQNTYPAFNNQKFINTSDGGFLIAVTSGIYDLEKDLFENRSNYDSYAVKTDSTGKMEWFTKISTPDREEHINYMIEDKSGNYVIFNRVIPTFPEVDEDEEKYMEIVKIKSPYSSVKDNVNNSEFSISPNPAEDYVEILVNKPSEGLEPSEGSEIEIYDVLGNLVINYSTPSLLRNATPCSHPDLSGQEGNFKIDVSHLPKGVYFVKIGNITEKFVKM